jgi:predicted Ser/Thr protein kinase
MGAANNPFSSIRVQPGAIPFILPHGADVSELWEILREKRRPMQILGPHGSGKSTLVHALAKAASREVARVEKTQTRAEQLSPGPGRSGTHSPMEIPPAALACACGVDSDFGDFASKPGASDSRGAFC